MDATNPPTVLNVVVAVVTTLDASGVVSALTFIAIVMMTAQTSKLRLNSVFIVEPFVETGPTVYNMPLSTNRYRKLTKQFCDCILTKVLLYNV